MKALATFAAIAALVLGCAPEFDDRDYLVVRERVLAVHAEPAEARPGSPIELAALVAGASGSIESPAIEWAFCTTPRSPLENEAVSLACLSEPGILLEALPGGRASSRLPLDGCARFGPDPPPGDARPRDPDATGGFYQPIRLRAFGQDAFFLARISCNLADVSIELAREFSGRYQLNQNPEILELSVPGSVARGSRTEFRITWPESSVESYVHYDPRARTLVDRRESLRVSWFSTGGRFDHDRTGRAEEDLATESRNTWTAPVTPGSTDVFVVVRDSRGGSAFLVSEIVVE